MMLFNEMRLKLPQLSQRGRLALQLFCVAIASGVTAGCDDVTVDPAENWSYLVCTLKDRPQPEHVAFAIKKNGKGIAAYRDKSAAATITPFEINFSVNIDIFHKWRISRTDGAAEVQIYDRIYRGTCTPAEKPKF